MIHQEIEANDVSLLGKNYVTPLEGKKFPEEFIKGGQNQCRNCSGQI